MFEKQATQYALEWGEKTDGTYACCRDGFIAGAKFGYNKAKEEMQAQIEKMKADYDKLLDEKIELEDRLAESRECY